MRGAYVIITLQCITLQWHRQERLQPGREQRLCGAAACRACRLSKGHTNYCSICNCVVPMCMAPVSSLADLIGRQPSQRCLQCTLTCRGTNTPMLPRAKGTDVPVSSLACLVLQLAQQHSIPAGARHMWRGCWWG